MKPAPPPAARTGLSSRLLQAWQSRGLLAHLLWPLSCLLSALVRLRRSLYRRGWLSSERLPVVVIVVGNVVAGGAGKTPTVLALLDWLARQGLKAGVVSRGYGRQGEGCVEVRADSLAREVGDEPLLIQRRSGVPVFVARRRAEAARALLAAHPDTQVLVCDDGLQHLALQRDIELCVFDDRGIGNGWLQPAGPLREPWPRAVDLLLHTGERPAFDGFRAHRELAPLARNGLGQTSTLQALRDRPWHALAGIAHPERFFNMLAAAGLQLQQTSALPDHHDYERHGVPASAPGLGLLCTEKDAHKLWPLRPEAWSIGLEFEPEPAFWQALQSRLTAALSSLPSPTPANAASPHGQQTS